MPESNIEIGVVVARYHYITSELHRLNGETHKLFASYISTVSLLGGGAASVLVGRHALGLTAKLAISTELVLVGLISFVSVGALLLLVANVMSWIDYRHEEYSLCVKYGLHLRQPPEVGNVLRWFEFWFGLLMAAVPIVAWLLFANFLIPILGNQ